MTRRAASLLAPCFVALAAVHTPPHVGAQADRASHEMRLATLLPRGGGMQRGLTRWNRRLAELTEGRVQVRVYWGGSMGDETTMVRRMRHGQLHAASLTSTGLALIHPPVTVMQAPGVFRRYSQVDAVREAIGPEMAERMEAEGFSLLGWGDAGRVRLFSRGQAVRRPSDLRRMRPWIPRSNTVFREMLGVIGANGVQLSVGEVLGALGTRRVDVVPGPAIAAAALQWFTSLDYMTADSDGFLIGGMVVSTSYLATLSRHDREALFLSARENHEEVIRLSRRGDERAYEALSRRIQPVEIGPHRAEWQRVAEQTRQRLAGRVYPAALLSRVEQIAGAAP